MRIATMMPILGTKWIMFFWCISWCGGGKGWWQASQTVGWSSMSSSGVDGHIWVHFRSLVVTLLTPLSSSSAILETLDNWEIVIYQLCFWKKQTCVHSGDFQNAFPFPFWPNATGINPIPIPEWLNDHSSSIPAINPNAFPFPFH